LGIEAYGLIAFLLTLQNILQLFDFGLGPLVNRQVARFATSEASLKRAGLGPFLTALEKWYWLVGLGLGVILYFAAPRLAGWWIRPEMLPDREILESAEIFALLLLFQWPSGFYQNALSGLQRQVILNAVQIPFSALTSLGGVIFIWLGPRSVTALLSWQVAVCIIQLSVVYALFWHSVGITRYAHSSMVQELRNHWQFSAGMIGISVTGIAIVNLDRIILSRILPLSVFGHYSLALGLARGLFVLISPVFNAYFPRLSNLVSLGEKAAIRDCYHVATQLMLVMVVPAAAVLALFSGEIANLWLHDQALSKHVAPIGSLLAVGTCLNALTQVPYALQLAYARTGIGFYINLFLLVTLIPVTIIATITYGAVGAAWAWIVLNLTSVSIALPLTHRAFGVGNLTEWALVDVLPAILVALPIALAGRLLLSTDATHLVQLGAVSLTWCLSTVAATMALEKPRQWLLRSTADLLCK
jgi:O-antigen/teichoic acid export membrane protein